MKAKFANTFQLIDFRERSRVLNYYSTSDRILFFFLLLYEWEKSYQKDNENIFLSKEQMLALAKSIKPEHMLMPLSTPTSLHKAVLKPLLKLNLITKYKNHYTMQHNHDINKIKWKVEPLFYAQKSKQRCTETSIIMLKKYIAEFDKPTETNAHFQINEYKKIPLIVRREDAFLFFKLHSKMIKDVKSYEQDRRLFIYLLLIEFQLMFPHLNKPSNEDLTDFIFYITGEKFSNTIIQRLTFCAIKLNLAEGEGSNIKFNISKCKLAEKIDWEIQSLKNNSKCETAINYNFAQYVIDLESYIDSRWGLSINDGKAWGRRQNLKRCLDPKQKAAKHSKFEHTSDISTHYKKEDENTLLEGHMDETSFLVLTESSKSESFIDLSLKQTTVTTHISIKQELIPINVSEIMEILRLTLVDKRKGNNTQDNCGHITHYTLLALENLLQGKEPPANEISTEPLGIDTTATEITYGYFYLKGERGEKIKKQLRTVSAALLPTPTGLHSILPPKISPYISLDKISTETFYINLEADKIPVTPTNIQKVNEDLKLEALKTGGIIIGELGFAKLGKKLVGHVIAFCATEREVFFIDGQLIDGNKKDHPDDAVFTSLLDNANYEFATAYDLAPSEEAFGDNCFYLVHKAFPNNIPVNRVLTAPHTIFFKPKTTIGPFEEIAAIDDMEIEAEVDLKQKSLY